MSNNYEKLKAILPKLPEVLSSDFSFIFNIQFILAINMRMFVLIFFLLSCFYYILF